jgi:hypothetical protein
MSCIVIFLTPKGKNSPIFFLTQECDQCVCFFFQPNGNWPVPFTTGFGRVHKIQQENSGSFVGLAYQGKDIVFRFIIEYSSLRDFGLYFCIRIFER